MKPLYKESWENNIYRKRYIKKDIKEKFIHLLMKNGEKSKAYKIFNNAGQILQKKIVTTNKKEQKFRFLIKKGQCVSSKLSETIIYSNSSTLTEVKPLYKSFMFKKSEITLENILRNSIENIKPTIEVRKVRIAGTTYQVPAIISMKRQETLAIRWIIDSAIKRKQRSSSNFAECLAQELLDAYNKIGLARQKRDELHKIAESNRAYIRFRWW